MKRKYHNEALDAVHETIQGLHRLDLVNTKTMREFDRRNLKKTDTYNARLQGIAAALGELAGPHMERDLAEGVLESLGLTIADLRAAVAGTGIGNEACGPILKLHEILVFVEAVGQWRGGIGVDQSFKQPILRIVVISWAHPDRGIEIPLSGGRVLEVADDEDLS